MKKAAIYNRCSTEEEAQMNALTIQAAESREIVLKKGWLPVEQYIESESGTTSRKRSEYQRLLEDMETDKFDIIVIKSIDRLMRSAKDWYIFLDKLTVFHKQLYIYIDNRFYTPDDSLLTGIKAILAEDFSRELSKKIKNAHRRRQTKKTGFNITMPMFGWDKVGKDKFVLNREEAEAYRLAFALAKEGKGFYSIANIMYENGVKSKSGTRISDVQWRKMLYAARAHGTVVLHTTEYDFEAKKRIKVPEEEWIYVENALPPIVSKEYQMEVLAAILNRTVTHNFKEYTRDMTTVGLYELSGKLYCADCGKVYYRNTFTSKEGVLIEWKCSTALKQGRKSEKNPQGCGNINVIEAVVLEKIQEVCRKHYEVLFEQEETIVHEALSLLQKVLGENSSEKEAERIVKEMEKLKKKKRVLLHKLMDGIVEDIEFRDANCELSEKIAQLQHRIDDIKVRSLKYNDYDERLCKIREALQNGLIEQAKTRELIARVDKIWVHPDGMLEIVFDEAGLGKLLGMQNRNVTEKETEEICCRIMAKYEHKNNIVRKRERVNKEIINLFMERPELTLKEVSGIIGVSDSYIYTSVKGLKEQGVLCYERNGNTHTGRWIVNTPV